MECYWEVHQHFPVGCIIGKITSGLVPAEYLVQSLLLCLFLRLLSLCHYNNVYPIIYKNIPRTIVFTVH